MEMSQVLQCLECGSDSVGISWTHPFNAEHDRVRCASCGCEWRRCQYNEEYREMQNRRLDESFGAGTLDGGPNFTDQNIQWNFKSLNNGNVKIDIVAGALSLNLEIPADDVEMIAAIMNVRAGEARSNASRG